VKGAEGADARDEGIPGEGRGTMPARRYLLVVNDCDVVPRMLGSPMPVGTLTVLGAVPQGGAIAPAVLRRHVELLQVCRVPLIVSDCV